MRKTLFIATIGLYSFFAHAVWPPRPLEVCSTLLADPNAFVAQLSLKNNLEDFMAKCLSEVRQHPTFAALDPARILLVKSADSSPPAIWVFPAYTTAALGLADGISDRHGSSSGRTHKFVSPLEYQLSDLRDPSPAGKLVFIPTISSAALFTSDGRTLRPHVGHISFDYLEVYRRRLTSTQIILAFGNLIDRAEPALRKVYNQNYYYILGELLANERLLEVLDPENVVKVTNHGYPYFVFLGIKAAPFYGFVWHSEAFECLLADADRGNFVELKSFEKSGDTLELTPSGRQKLILFLAKQTQNQTRALLDLADVDYDCDVYDLQHKLFPASGFFQHFLKVLSDNGQMFPK